LIATTKIDEGLYTYDQDIAKYNKKIKVGFFGVLIPSVILALAAFMAGDYYMTGPVVPIKRTIS